MYDGVPVFVVLHSHSLSKFVRHNAEIQLLPDSAPIRVASNKLRECTSTLLSPQSAGIEVWRVSCHLVSFLFDTLCIHIAIWLSSDPQKHTWEHFLALTSTLMPSHEDMHIHERCKRCVCVFLSLWLCLCFSLSLSLLLSLSLSLSLCLSVCLAGWLCYVCLCLFVLADAD